MSKPLSQPSRKILDNASVRATITDNETYRKMSRDDSSPEMRQHYDKGDMKTPVSFSSHHGHGSSRDKDHVKRSNTSDRSDRDSKTSSSSRSSRDYDQDTVRGQ